MDYWERVKLTVHDDADAFFKATDPSKLRLFSSKASHGLWETSFVRGEFLVFGSETRGIDASILAGHSKRVVRIPQVPEEHASTFQPPPGLPCMRQSVRLATIKAASREVPRLASFAIFQRGAIGSAA